MATCLACKGSGYIGGGNRCAACEGCGSSRRAELEAEIARLKKECERWATTVAGNADAASEEIARLTRERDEARAEGGAVTHTELVQACKNIGFDLTCGSCASLFYTGYGGYEHCASCTTKGVPHCPRGHSATRSLPDEVNGEWMLRALRAEAERDEWKRRFDDATHIDPGDD